MDDVPVGLGKDMQRSTNKMLGANSNFPTRRILRRTWIAC